MVSVVKAILNILFKDVKISKLIIIGYTSGKQKNINSCLKIVLCIFSFFTPNLFNTK